MANQRNQQLKVWNQWNAGVQNIPADHLINDQAFTQGFDYDITDSTLKPIKTNAPYTDIVTTPTTKQVLKENIKGVDTPIVLNNPIEYINYADTLYYIDITETGSPLKQVYKDENDTVQYVDALPILTGELTSLDTIDNVQEKLRAYFNRMNSAYLTYYSTVHSNLDQQDEVHGVYTSNAILDRFLPFTMNVEIRDSIDTVTYDTYPEVVASIKANLQNCINETTLVITETEGELKERLKSMVASMQYGAELSKNASDISDVYGGSKAKSLFSNIDSDQYGEPDVITAWLIEFATPSLDIVTEYLAYSVTRYIKVDTGYLWWSDNTRFTKSYPSIYQMAERVQDIINDIITAKETLNIPAWADYPNNPPVNLALIESVGLERIKEALSFLSLTSWISKVVDLWGESLPYPYRRVISSVTGETATISYNFTKINEKTKTFRSALEGVELDEQSIGLSSYAVVGYKKSIGAYTNMITKVGVLDSTRVTLSFDAVEGIDEYLIYRKDTLEGEYEWQETVTTSPVTLTAPYTSGGAVPVVPYRVAKPPQDFTSIAEYKGSIFLNRKDSQEIWFTNPNNPHDMSSLSFIKMPQDVKAMKTAGAGLFIWTTNNTLYLLTGSPLVDTAQGNTNTLAIKLVGEGVDIINKHAVASQDSLVVWLSHYAIHNTAGYGSADTTAYLWEPKPIDKALQSLIYRGKIYFLVDYKDGTRGLITFDTSRKAVTQITTDIDNLSLIDDKLIGIKEGAVYEMFQGDGVTEYDVTLKSFAGYSYDTRLQFHSVTIAHNASPYEVYDKDLKSEVSISIDDIFVGSWNIQGTDASRIQLPITNNTSTAISISIKGSLNIKSVRLRYTTKDWED